MIYIKYSGAINSKDLLKPMKEEFQDICEISKWEFEIVNEDFNSLTAKAKKEFSKSDFFELDEDLENEITHFKGPDVYLEGISIGISKGVEPLKFTFDKNGQIAAISFYTTDTVGINSKITVKKYEFMYFPYIKIYTGNYETHIKMIKILDYVKKKYIKNLEVIDTSFFWDNRDEEALILKFWKERKNKQITR
jgi:hypothetical protein